MSRDPLFQERRSPVLMFIGGGALIVLILVLAFAREQGWFVQTFPLQFRTDSAEALKKGMVVRLSGLVIGTVQRIKLDDDAKVTVELQIQEEYRRWLRADSQAVLAREGVFGDGFIQMTTGTMSAAAVKDEAELTFDPGTDMAALLLQLRERLFPLLEQINVLVTNLNAPDGGLQGTLSEARSLLAGLQKTRAEMDKTFAGATVLTQKTMPKTFHNLDKTLGDISVLSANIDQRLATISNNLATTLTKYEGTSTNADAALKDMQRLLNETRPQLQQVLRDADVLIRNSNQTMNNMQEHWPFTSDAPIPAAQMPPPDKQAPTPEAPTSVKPPAPVPAKGNDPDPAAPPPSS